MESTTRTFRHSFGKLALMFLGVFALAFVIFLDREMNYFFVGLIGIGFVVVLTYATSNVKISNDEITVQKLLSSKSLKWVDVARVSMRGQALRLHNRDEDIVLSLDSQLDDYTEILDIIFSRRPDLFDFGDNDTLSQSILNGLFVVGFGLLLVGLSAFIYFSTPDSESFLALIFIGLGLYTIVAWLLSPQSIVFEGRNMVVRYLFKQASFSAGDINSITLEKRRTRNGYIYFVRLNLKNGKTLKLPTFKQGIALSYQIFKRWHEKANSTQQFVSNNYN